MKLRAILIFLILLSVKSWCYGRALGLDESINIALENSLDIKRGEIVLNISSYRERAAQSLFYPALSLIGSSIYLKDIPENNQYVAAGVKLPLYSGGKLTNDVKASRESKNAQLFSLHGSELFLENKVFKEYMNCLKYWKFSKAYLDALERADLQIASVNRAVKAGKRGDEDILRWQVLIDNYKEKLVSANKDLANAKVRLDTLMNRDASEPIEVADSHLLRFEYIDFMIRQQQYSKEQMINMFLDYAGIFNPTLKQKSAEELAANHYLLSEQATLRPTVDLLSNYGGRSTSSYGVYNSWDTGMYASFDLYRQQKFENIKIRKLQLELSKVEEQQTMRDLKSDVRTLYASNASLNEQVNLQRKQQKTSRQYLKEVSAKYAAGGVSNLEVIEAFDSFYKNQVALVDSTYNAFTEFANLYNLIGFSFLYRKPAPNMYWRYKEHGLKLDYDLKSLEDPVFQFMDERDFEKAKSIFKNNPSFFKIRDKAGQTALHYAVDRGYVDCVEFILQNGADPDAVNYLDGTPLVRAICFCPAESNLSISNLLIKYGADVNKVSHYYTPLNWAAMKNKIDIAKALVHAGAKVNARDAYMKLTPLHFSAFWGNVDMAKFFVESGADMSLENSDGLTPYDLAWQYEYLDLVKFFDSIGAK